MLGLKRADLADLSLWEWAMRLQGHNRAQRVPGEGGGSAGVASPTPEELDEAFARWG